MSKEDRKKTLEQTCVRRTGSPTSRCHLLQLGGEAGRSVGVDVLLLEVTGLNVAMLEGVGLDGVGLDAVLLSGVLLDVVE